MARSNAGSLVVWLIGLVVVLAALWVLFTQTGLERYIPVTVAIAVVLLIAGIAVMAMSGRFAGGDRVVHDHGGVVGGGTVREREVVYDDDRRL